ncbi:MAG TPA: TPM domain-containing protein [Chitinophagaceae bacterium]|nr:TPM domain-containing protein [Chitinophagaceae bacterium]
MRLIPWRRPTEFFTQEEKENILAAVRAAERLTSGEIRVFVESRCRYVDALDRAADLFFRLGMEKTEDRNAVLLYLAVRDRQVAVFGDEGIHRRVGADYWKKIVGDILAHFNRDHYAEGVRQSVMQIGEALRQHFPFDNDTDKNELPDDIVFGK